ncbi:MAG: hypothetical protein V4638_05570 [Bacteroidota bacterium]
MKNIKLILAAFLMTTTFAVSAQEQTVQQKATIQTEQMAVQLSLSEQQKTQIHEINLGVMQKNDAVKQDASMTPEVKVESLKQNDQARIDLINLVLTDEQKAKFAESNAKSKAQIERGTVRQLQVHPTNIAPKTK